MNTNKKSAAEGSSEHAGRHAAKQYTSDEAFAEAFDAELEQLYSVQLAQLDRLASRIGRGRVQPAAAARREGGTAPAAAAAKPMPLDQVLQAIRDRGRDGASRGEVAAHFDLDSRDARLTRALRILKNSKRIDQRGTRRSARYFVHQTRAK